MYPDTISYITPPCIIYPDTPQLYYITEWYQLYRGNITEEGYQGTLYRGNITYITPV